MRKNNDTYQKIIIAASQLISERGVGSTSTKLVAERAGVSTGALFHYFATKQALVETVYWHCTNTLMESVLVDYSEDLPIRDRFFRFWSNVYRYTLEHPSEMSLFTYLVASPHIERDFRIKLVTRMHESQRQLFKQARDEKIFKDLDTATIARIIEGGIAYLSFRKPSESSTVDEEHIEQIIQVFWDGLRR